MRNQLTSNETNNAINDGNHKWDEDEWGPDPFKPTTKDIVGEDEYKKYQDIYDMIVISNELSKILNNNDIVLAIGLVVIVCMMVIPLPVGQQAQMMK